MCGSLVSNINGPKTLLGTRMHHGGLGSFFVALILLDVLVDRLDW